MRKHLLIFPFILLPFISIHAQKITSIKASANPVKSAPGVNRTDLVTFAKQYLGTPYHKCSNDPQKGFDCSGFVYYVFKNFNVTLPRSSMEYKSIGKTLKPNEFKVGDILVFYGYNDSSVIGHVGIICEANGMKSRFIHSSSGKDYGVTISNLDSKGYHRRFYKCINVLN
ncbi:MAG: C40 family peptidase [Bacteroidales bacterium]|nr:C40 family peptidase [Bacteroidales bacterium]MDD4603338.1 C40 family peptidase [Bacteroidales bacterium]